MISAPLLRPTALCGLLILGGCAAASGEFPSLQPREVERNISLEEPVRTPPVVAPSAELTSQAQGLLGRARAGDRAFDAEYPRAQRAAAAAGGSGTDSWVAAQEAVSRLEASRAETTRALADLDQLLLARAAVPTNAGDYAAIREAKEMAQALADGQSARIAGLRSRLGL